MKKKWLMIGICLAAIILWGARVIWINLEYPSPKVYVQNKGDQTLYIQDCAFVLKDWTWSDGKVLKEISPYFVACYDKDGREYPAERIRVALVRFDVVNSGAGEITVDLDCINFESGAWHNSYDPELFWELNDDMGSVLELKPGEKIEDITVPLLLYDFQFKKGDWKKVDKRRFDMVLNIYPVKYVIREPKKSS